MPSTHVIKVPDLGEGIAEVELVAWHVQAGDAVVEDQGLADVMTDKATVEIPSPVAGRVLVLGAEVGQVIAVGTELIRIEVAGVGEAPVAAPADAATPAAPAAKFASEPSAQPTAPVRPEPPPTPPTADRPIAEPAVRRRARELGVDLKDVPATGSAGRIMHVDLDVYVAARGARPPGLALRACDAERNDERTVPVIGLRRRIALQMQESKRCIPHFSYIAEVDVTEVEASTLL